MASARGDGFGGLPHRRNDILVAGAAAEVAGEHVADALVGEVERALRVEMADDVHDHARRAVAALQGMTIMESLLERMERFKGLAILATNRKKDLDEAFLRRLRYIVDFPLPDADERRKIWRQVIPEGADSSQLEFDFLAEQFPLSGGNIRSIVFNACLQCADGSKLSGADGESTLTMKEVVVAVKREFDKMNRSLSLEQFGSYASLVEGLERE